MSGGRISWIGRGVLAFSLWFWCSWATPAVCEAQRAAPLRRPSAMAVDAAGNLYVADLASHQVIEATLAGERVVVAGSGAQGFAGDGGPASRAELNSPQGLAFGADGSLYIADTGNQRIRVVSSLGTITTFAGTGRIAFGGDGGSPLAASFDHPTALAVDAQGGLLICDTNHHRLRRIVNGGVTTIAGTGVQGFSGDGSDAVSAQLDSPEGVAAAPGGRVFLADTHNQRIRLVDSAGKIHTVAGTGLAGYSGDGSAATGAQLANPRGLALQADGSLLIADAGNVRIRRLDPGGTVSTLVGDGVEGGASEGSLATSAALRSPGGISVPAFGRLALADTLNGAVRVLTAQGRQYQPAAFVTEDREASVLASTQVQMTYGPGSFPVQVTGPIGVPAGNVRAAEGGTQIGNVSLVSGQAAVDLSGLSAGDHQIALTYGGDGLNAGASLNGIAVHVSALPVTAMATAVSVPFGAALPSIPGTLAGVLAQDQGQVDVAFHIAAGDLPSPGSYTVAPSLTGAKAGNYAVSLATGSGQLTVTRATANVQISAPAQIYSGIPVNLTASVIPQFQGVPGGTVQLLDGGKVIATSAMQNGRATVILTPTEAGVHSFSAAYLGDVNFFPGSSPAMEVSISAMPDFAVASAASSVSVVAGQAATVNLKVQSLASPFTGSVVFSVAGLPAGTSAAFSPPVVVPGSESVAVQLQFQTLSGSSAVQTSAHRHRGGPIAVCLCALLSGGMLRRRSRRRIAGLALLLGLCGCGARTVGEGLGGVLAQSYAVQITGTSTNLAGITVSHSVPLTLTVQSSGP